MDKAILKFVNYNEKYLFNKSLLKKKLFAKGKGDLDFYDKNKQLRKSFETLSKREKYITIKRYHKTGLRIDVLNNNLDFYSLDFLNGVEKNPLFFGLYNGSKIKKIDSKKIKFKLIHLKKIIINLFKFCIWRYVSIVNQKPTIIEFFGVDGSGKTYLSNKIYYKLHGNISVYKLHLWKFINNQISCSNSFPYKHKDYNYYLSFFKEIFILINIIIIFFKISVKKFRKSVYLFERSCWDIYIDPTRYRLNYKPFFIKTILGFFLKSSYKFYLKKEFSLIKKRKNEISYKQFISLNKKLDKFFENHKYILK